MKHVVISENLKEFEIHPPELFDKYRDITKNEIEKFIKKWKLFNINCPACNSKERIKVFDKFSMDYVECKNCKTLYVNPRPSEKDTSNYYKISKSTLFWKEHFYKETVLDRKRIIFNPRSLWIMDITKKYFDKPKIFMDINSKYIEFIEKMIELNIFQENILFNPLIDLNLYTKEKLKIINKNNIFNVNVITAFEVIDRLSNPKKFLKNVNSMLIKNGLLFLTTSTISGFDLQLLWDKSKNIFPLDHMNLFSIEGIVEIINNSGFKIIELSTPGQLDIEIVKNAIKQNNNIDVPRFISYFIENRDENDHRAFQDFLQISRLSSHLRIVAQKN